MSAVLDFIFQQQDKQKEILLYFHDLFTNELKLTSKIRYKIPFYDGRSWICYLNPKKSGSVELAFIRGREIAGQYSLLESKERKQIAGIEFHSLSDLPFKAVHEIINEALLLDKERPYKGPANKFNQ